MKRLILAYAVLGLVGCSKTPENKSRADTAPDAPKPVVVQAVVTTTPPKAAAPATKPAEQYGEAQVHADCQKKGLRLADSRTTNTAYGKTRMERWEVPGAGVWMIVTYHDGQVVSTTTGHD